ncbi:receptor-like protein 33 [Lactuca sativa]|uniref:receptor-like protein 33 n=1 Tax=Lactuca sativa TaxID=4236 RepID=UPI0022AF7CF4|nr:receptor-like protein 33 [Lactuca sativa]
MDWIYPIIALYSGVIPPQCLRNISSTLRYLYLQSNQIQGQFPPSFCNLRKLEMLDISNNRFSGVIPKCLRNIISSLVMVDMGNNSFHGIIPDVYKECGELQGLILNGNQLQGEIPSSLSKCQSLMVLDLGNNKLNGTFPHWLGDLPALQALVCESSDLSHNEFEGHLPRTYLQNFNAMKNAVKNRTTPTYLSAGGKYYSVTIMVKGRDLHFLKISVDYVIVDLSNNRFEGEILGVIGCLASLIVLDLSHNSLTGQIPSVLGNISEIESLDLSCNQLTGEIPRSLAGLTFLAFLNLSHNHLGGHIPSGTQFTAFTASSFGGNPELCGIPLPNKCEHPLAPQLQVNGDGDEESGDIGVWVWAILGLVMGYVMLSTGRPKWFNAIVDAGEHTIKTRHNRRRYVYIGK